MEDEASIELSENKSNGSNTIALKAPALLSFDYTYTLPATPATDGMVLSSDGGGAMSWVNKLSNVSGDSSPQLSADLNTDEDLALFDELTKKSITLIKNTNKNIPLKNLSSKIAYLKMGDSDSEEFYKMLNHYTKVDKIDYNFKSSNYNNELLKLGGLDGKI